MNKSEISLPADRQVCAMKGKGVGVTERLGGVWREGGLLQNTLYVCYCRPVSPGDDDPSASLRARFTLPADECSGTVSLTADRSQHN